MLSVSNRQEESVEALGTHLLLYGVADGDGLLIFIARTFDEQHSAIKISPNKRPGSIRMRSDCFFCNEILSSGNKSSCC